MSIWDEIDTSDLPAQDENPYLEDEAKALELIADVLKIQTDEDDYRNNRNVHRLSRLLSDNLLQSLESVSVENEMAVYDKLFSLSAKLGEQLRLAMLKNKKIIGVGGKFSSGKSCFINSILQEEFLPENQDETTSIPTYITRSEQPFFYAFLNGNRKVGLSSERVNAICHQFKRKFGIGFAGFVNCIVAGVENFGYSNTVILDTPGYNKDDSSVIQEMSDESKAKRQLQTIDYLIWLIDITDGTLVQKSVEFIKSLNLETPVLFVINKADKKPPSIQNEIINSVKTAVEQAGINCFDVIAYSSHEQKEYSQTNGIERFLKTVDGAKESAENIGQDIMDTVRGLISQLEARKAEKEEQAEDIAGILADSNDILDTKGIAYMYGSLKTEIRHLEDAIGKTEINYQKIKLLINEMGL